MEMATATQKHLGAMPLQQTSQPPPTTQIQILESSGPELIKSVQSILNEMSPYNMLSIIKRFKALPIDNMYYLEKTVDLVFEKAIEEQWFAPLCSSLCSAMQSLKVISNNGKKATFKNLIIDKCQSLFELDKDQEVESAKKYTKIRLCKDQEKKKELQLEFLELKRRLCKRSVGNCRFIGELFKQNFLPPIIMLLCVQNLSTKYAEVPLECLCNLLKTAGKELEQLYNLDDTFKKLQDLTNTIIIPNISLRIMFMIQGIISLRMNKWIPSVENKPKLINYVKNEAVKRQSISPVYDRPKKRNHHGDHKFRSGENKNGRGNEDLFNVDRNDSKYKQQNSTIDQTKLQGLKENTSVTNLGSSKWSFSTDNNMTSTSHHPYAVLSYDENSFNCLQNMSNEDTSKKPIISESEERQKIMSGTAFSVTSLKPQFAQLSPLINSSNSKPIETVEEHIMLKLESEVTSNTYMKCENVKYENLDDSSSVATLLPPKQTRFTSSNFFAVLNDNEKSLKTQQIMSNNTTKESIVSETEESQRIMFGIETFVPQFAQSTPSLNFSKTVEEPVLELDSVIAYTINMKCKRILLEFEKLQNIDNIINALSKDESSVIRTMHEEFVKSMSLITLDNNPVIQTTVVGKIFAELLSKKILSMVAITQGIDAVLKNWNYFMVDYPQFFSYIAAIIAPLLLSQNASFDFNNLKDSCKSLQPDNSSKFFTEVLNKIHGSKETQNTKELGGILWIYYKWRASENVSLDVFIPNNQINEYFKNNLIGVFLLSIAMYDKMKPIDDKLLYDIMPSWININISAEIIKRPQFVLALTIAIVMVICSKLNHSYDDFFNHVHVKLLNCYIRFEPLLQLEIQAREVQCLCGIQLMSALLQHPGGMSLKLFHKLYHDGVISKESFELFIKKYEETADL
eukprot:XP_016662059.1 PREDICTED: eukaryotic translation initiation factor 4 gamma 3-like isoform X2 [Acyrthosiphon pisum]